MVFSSSVKKKTAEIEISCEIIHTLHCNTQCANIELSFLIYVMKYKISEQNNRKTKIGTLGFFLGRGVGGFALRKFLVELERKLKTIKGRKEMCVR